MNTFTLPPQPKVTFKPTPYARGFEDCRYDREYRNPYKIGTPAWHEYCRGNEDARAAEREARV